MEFLYGYSVAADLRPGTRYDQVARGAGVPWRAGGAPRAAAWSPGARAGGWEAGARERVDRPEYRVPAQVESGVRGERTVLGANERKGAPRAPEASRARAIRARDTQATRARDHQLRASGKNVSPASERGQGKLRPLKARKPPGRGRLPQVGLEGQAGVRSSEASGVRVTQAARVPIARQVRPGLWTG